MYRILLVDAFPRLREMSKAFWRGTGYSVDLVEVRSMQAAIEHAMRSDYWYIDINADSIRYLQLLPILRSSTKVPIIALTDNFNTRDEIAAYHAGLDIYTTWEIGFGQQTPESIIAYMSRGGRQADGDRGLPKILVHNHIVLSRDNRNCQINGVRIPMTKTEFDILYYLMLNRGLVLSPQQIFQFVWGEDIYNETTPDSLRAHVKRLRKKMSAPLFSSGYIENVRGIGYRFIS